MSGVHGRDLPVLEALVADREESGEGLLLADVARLAGTRYPRRVLNRLLRAGYQVGEWRGRYQLGHAEPVAASTGASGPESTEPPSDRLPREPGAPVDVAPRLFDPLLLEAA